MLDRTRILPGLLQQLREQGIVAVLTVGVGRATTYVLSLIALTEGTGCECSGTASPVAYVKTPMQYTRIYTGWRLCDTSDPQVSLCDTKWGFMSHNDQTRPAAGPAGEG